MTSARTTAAPTSREVATVAGSFFTYGAIFFDRLAPLYLVALIAADLGVPSAVEGTLAMLIGLGWAAGMPIARAISGRVDDRARIALVAVIAASFGLTSAAATGWVLFVLLRGLGGIASAVGSPAVTSLVFSAAPARRRGLDLGIVQSATRIVGSLVSPAVVTAVAVAYGWRAAIVVSAGLLLLGAFVMITAVPRGGVVRRRGERPAEEFSLLPGGRRNVLLCTVACSLLLAWLMVWSQSSVTLVGGWLDVDAAGAGRLVGLFGIGAGAAALLVPTVSDRIGRRAALAVGSGLGGAGGVVLGVLAAAGTVPPRWLVVVLLVLAGVAMGGLPLTISLIPAESVATGDVGRALLWPIAGGEVLGAAALPALAAVAAARLGPATVVGTTAAGVLGLVLVGVLLRPLDPVEASGEPRDGLDSTTGDTNRQ